MVTKYYKYIPWLVLGAIGSYESATYFGHILLICCIYLLFL